MLSLTGSASRSRPSHSAPVFRGSYAPIRLLGIVVIVLAGVLTWQGLVAHRHQAARAEAERDAQWTATHQQASQAFGGGNYPEAERIVLAILPNAEKWYPRDRRLADALGMLGKSYRADHVDCNKP